jgi:hypothetical protein
MFFFLAYLPLHELILGRGWWQLIDLWGCPANPILAELSEPVPEGDHHVVRRCGHIASFLPIIETYGSKFAFLRKQFNRQQLHPFFERNSNYTLNIKKRQELHKT